MARGRRKVNTDTLNAKIEQQKAADWLSIKKAGNGNCQGSCRINITKIDCFSYT